MRHTSLSLVFGILTVACLACDAGPEPGPPPSEPIAAPPSEPTVEPASEPAPEPVSVPVEPKVTHKPLTNAAVFVIEDKDAVVLDADGFHALPDSRYLSSGSLARAPDGAAYGVMSSKLHQIHANGLEDLGEIPDSRGALAVGPDGSVWATTGEGVTRRVDGAWTAETIDAALLGDAGPINIAVDAANEPWVTIGETVLRRKAGQWMEAEVPKPGIAFLDDIGADRSGAVFLPKGDRLYRLGDVPERVKVRVGSFGSIDQLAFSSSGIGAVTVDLERVEVFQPEEQVASYREGKSFRIGSISRLGVDDQGRAWAVGDAGVAILGPGDAEPVVWRSGSMEAISGKIWGLMLVGDGPPLPEAGEIKKGGIAGLITKDEEPYAGAKIELCEDPDLYYSRTPCADAITRFKGETDAEGRFSFADVPLGAYGIAVKMGRSWQITLGSSLGSSMKEGEVYDIGTLALESESK